MSQTSSGIEPVFCRYKKKKKGKLTIKKSRFFVDEVGDSWEEYVVFHHRFKQWMEINGIQHQPEFYTRGIRGVGKKSPYYKATSNDVDYLKKAINAGAIQNG